MADEQIELDALNDWTGRKGTQCEPSPTVKEIAAFREGFRAALAYLRAKVAEPTCYARLLNGEIDWSEDCFYADPSGFNDADYEESDGYSLMKLFAAPPAERQWPAGGSMTAADMSAMHAAAEEAIHGEPLRIPTKRERDLGYMIKALLAYMPLPAAPDRSREDSDASEAAIDAGLDAPDQSSGQSESGATDGPSDGTARQTVPAGPDEGGTQFQTLVARAKSDHGDMWYGPVINTLRAQLAASERARKFAEEQLAIALKDVEQLTERENKAQQAREQDRKALQEIARGPIVPLPDPGAHSWRAFGEAAHRTMCQMMRKAQEAIAQREGT